MSATRINRSTRWALWWAASLVLGALIGVHGRAAPPPGHQLFSDGKIRTFKIDVPEAPLAALKKSERAYVAATVTVDGRAGKITL